MQGWELRMFGYLVGVSFGFAVSANRLVCGMLLFELVTRFSMATGKKWVAAFSGGSGWVVINVCVGAFMMSRKKLEPDGEGVGLNVGGIFAGIGLFVKLSSVSGFGVGVVIFLSSACLLNPVDRRFRWGGGGCVGVGGMEPLVLLCSFMVPCLLSKCYCMVGVIVFVVFGVVLGGGVVL